MERIKIAPEEKTPRVLFDGNKGILEIEGRSISEEPKVFYQEIIDGFDEYKKDPQKTRHPCNSHQSPILHKCLRQG